MAVQRALRPLPHRPRPPARPGLDRLARLLLCPVSLDNASGSSRQNAFRRSLASLAVCTAPNAGSGVSNEFSTCGTHGAHRTGVPDGGRLSFGCLGSSILLSPGLVQPVLRRAKSAIHGRRDVKVCPAVFTVAAVAETLKEESATKADIDPSAQGDSIRRRFLNFYRDRGHKVLPSSSLVPEDPTVLLTIAGMLQFKPVFLGQVTRPYPCVTTSQKCVRTNDVENVGRTARHHTFFEMLGNFSFGDYFKQQAIKWAWELATQEFKLPVDRLWVSVFEEDDEALSIWRDEVGVAEDHIKRMGADDNFWASGPTGPCGPCSEMYYDFHPQRGTANADLGDDSRFIEFYNLVFMQYNRKDDGSLENLASRNIDTGLGLERMAQILQKVPNNYETDLIFPIIQYCAQLAEVDYVSADEKTKTYLKVIGDHARAVVYLISDGVTPSNIGRGYVVRRLIRRAVRMGRLLGIRGDGKGDPDGAFLPLVAEVAVKLSSDVDPDVNQNLGRIHDELRREELRFVQTLERGEKLLEELLVEAHRRKASGENDVATLSGKDVFTLYDTFGFPVEITEEVAAERGVNVDMVGFLTEMDGQRKQSQAAHNVVKLSVGGAAAALSSLVSETKFLGYSLLESTATVAALLIEGEPVSSAHAGDQVAIVLDKTPFYAESGGQIGDHGLLLVQGDDSKEVVGSIKIKDVQKAGGSLFLHCGDILKGSLGVGSQVTATVDWDLRRRAQAHHTATHLLQAALRKVLGSDTSQAGSLVAFDRLRFDFNLSRVMTETEIEKVEAYVNEWIGLAVPLESQVMALADAKKSGAIAMFGEKYGEQVRVVNVPGISLELCGGTHVSNTAEIRGFKIVSEQGIASGVRRIEAVAGSAYIEYVNLRDTVVKQLTAALKVKAEDLPGRISGLQDEIKTARTDASELRAQLAIAKAASLADNATTVGPGEVRVIVALLEGVTAESLKPAAEDLLSKLGDPAAVVLGCCPGDGKVSIIATFTPKVMKHGLHAGKFVGGIAKICGGGGGGRPNFAQAGGKQPEKLSEALSKAREELHSVLADC